MQVIRASLLAFLAWTCPPVHADEAAVVVLFGAPLEADQPTVRAEAIMFAQQRISASQKTQGHTVVQFGLEHFMPEFISANAQELHYVIVAHGLNKDGNYWFMAADDLLLSASDILEVLGRQVVAGKSVSLSLLGCRCGGAQAFLSQRSPIPILGVTSVTETVSMPAVWRYFKWLHQNKTDFPTHARALKESIEGFYDETLDIEKTTPWLHEPGGCAASGALRIP